jgi:glycogen synthase
MFGWEFPPHNSGGLGVACQGLVRSLAKRGYRIAFVLPRQFPADTSHARILFADTYGADLSTLSAVGKTSFYYIDSPLSPYATAKGYAESTVAGRVFSSSASPLYSLSLIEEVYRYALCAQKIAEEESYDIVYAHDWLSFPAGIEAKRLSGKPLVVHVHSTEFDRCGGSAGVNGEVYAIEKKGMELADAVVVVSEFTKRIIVNNYSIPADKIHVAHNGIDEDMMPRPGGRPSQLAALKKAGYALVLFLGRITLQKGPDYFLRAAKRVLAHNQKVFFLVSGSGDMERQMMEYAADQGIAAHVLFSGFLRGAEQHEAYSLADLFVMPSVSEPFGIVALEAMHLGTPVIVSKQSGVSEVIAHALKVDFWDTEELANKILSSLAHPPLRETLRENAAREARFLTWDKTAERVDRIINALHARSPLP